jgi:hypothetical protein
MTFSNDPLDRLAPGLQWQADWGDVLRRAGERQPAGFVPLRLANRYSRIVAVVALVTVLIPLAAFGAANDWWFLESGGAPIPVNAPVVVKEGEWAGHPWQLIAYRSSTDGLCVSVTPTGSMEKGEGGALSCGPFAGVSRTGETKTSPDMTITFLSGSATKELPAYIAGPVIEEASEVEIHFAGSQILRVPTFAASAPVEHVRFYATQLPASVVPSRLRPARFPAVLKWIAGLDKDGDVVACLAPMTAKDGISPLSDCR